MTLTECFVRENIFVDFSAEVLYGDDQCYIDYPCRFPTVGFELMATEALITIADRIRKERGFRPMHPLDEYTDETCDNDGFYNFYVGLNGFSDTKVDSCIEFVVVNADSEDNVDTYTIELTEEEQIAIYNRLDEECRKHLGQSCEELLAEAQKRMEEDDT